MDSRGAAETDGGAAEGDGGRRRWSSAIVRTSSSSADIDACASRPTRSLDANGRPFELIYKDDTSETPTDIRPVTFA